MTLTWLATAWALAGDRDGDGVKGQRDRCPDAEEDVDGFDDVDGCPDPSGTIEIVVVDPNDASLPRAAISVSGPDGVTTGEGRLVVERHPGTVDVRAEAAGFAPGRWSESLDGSDRTLRLVLEPADTRGILAVEVRDTTGGAVHGATVSLDGGPAEPLFGTTLRAAVPAGPHLIVVRAPGSGGARALAKVAPSQVTGHVVILRAPRLTIQRERIALSETIQFETNEARILPESFSLLDEIAGFVADHPEIARIRVEGHTDNRGELDHNLDLSQRRAAAVVQAIVDRGIESSRLRPVGFGESRPLVPGDTEASWAINRRVALLLE